MMLVLSIVCLAFGLFEVWVYRQSHYEEDFYIICGSFFAAAFLMIMRLSGEWI